VSASRLLASSPQKSGHRVLRTTGMTTSGHGVFMRTVLGSNKDRSSAILSGISAISATGNQVWIANYRDNSVTEIVL
jgi:hypothetical protein